MKYIPLFSLEIFHDYYADQRCPDFVIEPLPETQKLFANFRCVIRPFPNGLRILALADNQNTFFIALPAQAVFSFHLRLTHPAFTLFTDFSALAAQAAPLYTNSQPGAELTLASRTASASETFSVRQPAAAETFVLSGRPQPGLLPAAFQVSGAGLPAAPRGYAEAAKQISLNSRAVEQGTAFTVTYPIAPQLAPGVFADVELQYGSTIAGAGGAAFQISFQAKKARWKYYIVTDKPANIPTIVDKDNQVIFDAADRTNITQSPDPADKVASGLDAQYPGMQIFRLVSKTLLPCRETVRKGLQLQINAESAAEAISNPPLENFTIDSRNAKQEDGLYHIIKYLNP